MSEWHRMGRISRRAILSGAMALALPWSYRAEAGAALGVGFADGLGLDPAALRAFCEVALGRPVILSAFPSVASLRDHLDAGLVVAALLPRTSAAGAASVAAYAHAPVSASLLLSEVKPDSNRSATTAILARAVADPVADAALLQLLARHGRPGPAASWLTLAPAHLAPNVAAGLVEGALVFGDVAPAPGVTCLALDPATAQAVSPRLALVWGPGLCGRLSALG